jgi:hypothetical protein
MKVRTAGYLLSATCLCSAARPTEARAQPATLEGTTAGNDVLRRGQRLEAVGGMRIEKGDVIETSPGGGAVVRFDEKEEAKALLFENTRVRVGSIWLWFGKVLSIGRVDVSNQFVLAAAEGTRYLVEVPRCEGGPARCEATLTVLEGHVRVSPPAGQDWAPLRLAALDRLTVPAEGGPRVDRVGPDFKLAVERQVAELERRLRRTPGRSGPGRFTIEFSAGAVACTHCVRPSLGLELRAALTPDRRLSAVLSGQGVLPVRVQTTKGPLAAVEGGLRYDIPLGSTGWSLGPALLGGWSGWSSFEANPAYRDDGSLTSLLVLSARFGVRYAPGAWWSFDLELGTFSLFVPLAHETSTGLTWWPSARTGVSF